MTLKLTSENVNKTFFACFYDEEDVIEGKLREGAAPRVEARSVMCRVGFNSVKVEAQTENIRALLDQLPLDFFPAPEGAGGMSFLKMPLTREGEHWGEHRDCDQLIALGLAAGLMEFPIPRAMWNALPGGAPYVLVNTKTMKGELTCP